jgi:hypothetical protein
MNNLPKMSIRDLKERHRTALLLSEMSVRAQPDTFRELKGVLRDINTRVLDVSEYYPAAVRLAGLLRSLIRKEDPTIFDYFIQNIDPCQGGNVRYFRSSCLDLADQLNCFDKWRADRRYLRCIK